MDRLDLRDQYLAKIQAEGTYRLVVAEHLTELLDAIHAYMNVERVTLAVEREPLLRLIAAYNLFVSNPAPATPDTEVS